MSERALIFDGPGRLSIAERGPVAPGRSDVLVATHSVGICGSDVHGYTGANQRRVPGMVMGHEAAGIVVDVGSEVMLVRGGDRVAINPAVTCGECEFCIAGEDHRCPQRRLYGCVAALPGAFAEQFVVHERNAVPFDGPAPLEWGALVEPLAVGDHGAGLLGAPQGHGVLIVGGGPIGLGAALGARRRGWNRIVVAEPNRHRRSIAEQLGLQTLDPSAPAVSEPAPFDAAVECVGVQQTLETALALTRPGAEIAVVGLGQTSVPFPIERLVVGERVVRGSFNYTRAEFRDVADWIAAGQVDLSPVIEARLNLEGVIEAFRSYADGTNDAMKTVYQPRGSDVEAREQTKHSNGPDSPAKSGTA